MRKAVKPAIAAVLFLAVFVYVNNTDRQSGSRTGSPMVLVHRGMSQAYQPVRGDFSTCTAVHILPVQHQYLENTIPSMRAAFERQADRVEFDVHPTTDGQFAVFHDRMLDCKTNGEGLTRSHSMEQLKALDIGYGYTADNGLTFPFRGKGVGLMPSMNEVFEAFPDRSFMIDVKTNDPNDGALLARHLSELPVEQRSRLIVFGREATLRGLREKLPDIGAFSAWSIQGCLLRYIAYGWTGVLPATCRNLPVFVPINVAPWLWGWPNLFMDRFEARGASIVLMGRYPAWEISPGLDALQDLAAVPPDYNGGIWTNDVEQVVAFLQSRQARAIPVRTVQPPSTTANSAPTHGVESSRSSR